MRGRMSKYFRTIRRIRPLRCLKGMFAKMRSNIIGYRPVMKFKAWQDPISMGR
ncbi:unnamed protein product, partial [Nesidiocoris tenuis]